MNSRKKRHNLLLLLPYLDLGGGARRVQVYCQYLHLFGWDVSVVLYSKRLMRDVHTIIGEQTPLYISSNKKEIVSFSKKQKIDVVYAIFDGQYDSFLEEIFILFKKNSIKIVVNNVFSYYDQRMMNLSDRVVFQTFYMGFVKFARALPKSLPLPLHLISYLTNPIHSQYLGQQIISPLEREKLRRELGFFPEHCVVGRFGRPDIIKWGDELLFALFTLRNEPNIRFLLVGVPRSRRYCISFLKYIFPSLQKTVVVLPPTGDDAKLMSLMQLCDIVGHSVNIGEGCSNAINECLYWGKPVITTMTPHCDNGQAEQIIHGQTGFFAQSVKDWVYSIRYLTYNPHKRKEMSEKARRYVLEHIDGPIIAQKFAAILDDVVDSKQKTVLTSNQYERFIAQYEVLLRQHLVYKPSSIWYKILRSARRVINYLEHQYWNE